MMTPRYLICKICRQGCLIGLLAALVTTLWSGIGGVFNGRKSLPLQPLGECINLNLTIPAVATSSMLAFSYKCGTFGLKSIQDGRISGMLLCIYLIVDTCKHSLHNVKEVNILLLNSFTCIFTVAVSVAVLS